MPKGDKAVIALLNDVLTAELTAINQYFLHAKMLQNWGYTKLAQFIRAESIDEMKHADEIIDRILYLEGIPNLQRLGKLRIGETWPEMLEADKALELEAIPRLNVGISVCQDARDNGTRAMLEQILVGEEHHLDWIEAQQDAIEQIGLQNYLAQQM